MRRFIKNFFFPTLQNNLKPYSLSFETFITVVGLTFLLEIAFYSYVVIFKNNTVYQILAGKVFVNQSSIPVTSADALTIAGDMFRQGVTSSRLIVENILLILLVYVFLVIFIPMFMTFSSHCSSNWKLKFKEIRILFKEPLHWAKWTVFMIAVLYVFNYFLSSQLYFS